VLLTPHSTGLTLKAAMHVSLPDVVPNGLCKQEAVLGLQGGAAAEAAEGFM